MFIDESWINFKQRTAYGWMPLRNIGFIDADIFKIILRVGFTRQRLYEIVGASSSSNSN